MATTLESPGGGTVALVSPHTLTVPSLFNAMLWYCPAAIATTLESEAGMEVCPLELSPQPNTVPSLFSARLKMPPAATAMTLERPAGTFVWPELPRPQLTTLPSLFSTRLCAETEAAIAFVKSGGTVLVPKVFWPQGTRVPFVLIARTRKVPQTNWATPSRVGGTLLSL